MELLKLIVSAIFIFAGLFIFVMATYGLFKFDYVLNRVHAAAKGDTLATLCVLLGLIVIEGFSVASLKLLFALIFLWLTNPVSSHLVVQTEVKTNPAYKNNHILNDHVDKNGVEK